MAQDALAHKRVLVTGCAGFLGSHVVDRWVGAGRTVIGIDSLMGGSCANLTHAQSSGRFTLLRHDIVSALPAETDVSDIGLVLNLACPASPPRYQADPIHTMKTCVHGTLNMAAVAAANGARFVQVSTSEVYGDPDVHPQREDYRGSVNPIGPRACYNEGKRAAETLLFDLHRQQGLDVAIARIFNTYGPRMDPFDGRVVSNMVRQALCGERLTIFGDGTQTRSFCYVDDLVDGLWRLAHAGPSVTGPINLGNPTEMTVLELAEIVRELTGRPVDLVFLPRPADDPVRRRPDITRAQSDLDWSPKVPVREGLQRTIDHFDNLFAVSGPYVLLAPNGCASAAE